MLVIDGTILLALAVEAPHSAFAASLVAANEMLAAPQAALVEAVEGARRLTKEGHLAQADYEKLPGLLPPLLAVLASDAPLLPRAAHVAVAHDLPLAAALALALAEARDARLATLDARLARAGLDVLGAKRVVHPDMAVEDAAKEERVSSRG